MLAVAGSGKLVVVEKPVSSFLRLHLSVNGSVELVPSNEEKVVIETDDNLQDYFEVVNSGRTLYVTGETKLRRPAFTHLRIQVHFRQLQTLNNACHGNVTMASQWASTDAVEIKIQAEGDTTLAVQAPSIKLITACEGNVVLRGSCNELDIKAASLGDMDCREMIAQHTRLSNSSQGNFWLYSQETIRIKHNGQGNVHYYGPGLLKDVRHNGEGEVRHLE